MSRTGRIAVIDYGMGNIHSMLKALRLYHDDVVFTSDHDVLRKADALVLPGDGAFQAAMDHLKESGLDDVIRNHAESGRPLLGVCIGFQVLFENSDEAESGLVSGLSLIEGHVRRFHFSDPSLRIPHMGWNDLSSEDPDYRHSFYFIHSYRAVDVPSEYTAASCSYGPESFCAAVQKGSILAFQFHPEKSDKFGLKLIENWVNQI